MPKEVPPEVRAELDQLEAKVSETLETGSGEDLQPTYDRIGAIRKEYGILDNVQDEDDGEPD